ncbi:MAG: hypothetical protein KZQ58_11975 [gamma proteobacterium symbiont of Bathyaustriella thionipta]|nr:hypothetical protein [gamma proteobacterium symbiont of Bathyaustriella thionipta]
MISAFFSLLSRHTLLICLLLFAGFAYFFRLELFAARLPWDVSPDTAVVRSDESQKPAIFTHKPEAGVTPVSAEKSQNDFTGSSDFRSGQANNVSTLPPAVEVQQQQSLASRNQAKQILHTDSQDKRPVVPAASLVAEAPAERPVFTEQKAVVVEDMGDPALFRPLSDTPSAEPQIQNPLPDSAASVQLPETPLVTSSPPAMENQQEIEAADIEQLDPLIANELFRPYDEKPTQGVLLGDLQSGLEKARRSYWEGHVAEAERQYQALTTRFPRNAKLLGEAGDFYYQIEQKKTAAKAYLQAGNILLDEGHYADVSQIVTILQTLDIASADLLQARLLQLDADTAESDDTLKENIQ